MDPNLNAYAWLGAEDLQPDNSSPATGEEKAFMKKLESKILDMLDML